MQNISLNFQERKQETTILVAATLLSTIELATEQAKKIEQTQEGVRFESKPGQQNRSSIKQGSVID